MDKTDATNLLTACPVGGPDGECTLGEAVQRLGNRIGAPAALSAAARLVSMGYLDHQRRGAVAYVGAEYHWHGAAVSFLEKEPELLQELGVAAGGAS